MTALDQPTPTRPLTFALIGLDHWYSAIPLAEGLAGSPLTRLELVVHDDPERGRPLAQRLGARFSTDPAEALEDPAIEAVGCFASVDRNPALAVAAASAGKHIVSVKPLARTLEEATRVVRAVEQAGVRFIPAETRSRMTPQNQYLRRLMDEGALGELVSAAFTLCGVLPRPWEGAAEPGGWWLEADRAPGGAWIDHSVYQIDRLRWLTGAEPVEALGKVANLRYPELEVEDYGHAVLTFDNGVVAAFEDTWTGADGAWRITTTLNGTRGSLSIDTAHGRMSLYRSEGAELPGWLHTACLDDDSDLIAPLVDRIRGVRNDLGDVHDAWRNLAAATAFYRSASTGTVQSVAQPEPAQD